MRSRPAVQPTPVPDSLKLSRTSWLLLIFFPELRREAVGAARFATNARKHLCFPTNRIECCRRGWCRQVTSLRCRDGGFLTWAAKPSVRESPDPAINVGSNSGQRHLCAGLPAL